MKNTKPKTDLEAIHMAKTDALIGTPCKNVAEKRKGKIRVDQPKLKKTREEITASLNGMTDKEYFRHQVVKFVGSMFSSICQVPYTSAYIAPNNNITIHFNGHPIEFTHDITKCRSYDNYMKTVKPVAPTKKKLTTAPAKLDLDEEDEEDSEHELEDAGNALVHKFRTSFPDNYVDAYELANADPIEGNSKNVLGFIGKLEAEQVTFRPLGVVTNVRCSSYLFEYKGNYLVLTITSDPRTQALLINLVEPGVINIPGRKIDDSIEVVKVVNPLTPANVLSCMEVKTHSNGGDKSFNVGDMKLLDYRLMMRFPYPSEMYIEPFADSVPSIFNRVCEEMVCTHKRDAIVSELQYKEHGSGVGFQYTFEEALANVWTGIALDIINTQRLEREAYMVNVPL